MRGRPAKPKHEFSYKELINIPAPDNQKTFTIREFFIDGAYVQTTSSMDRRQGGGSMMYFIGQGKFISARWLNSQALEITHDKTISFMKKDETFYFFGDHIEVIYIEK
jgi:hypothetical protein